MDYETERNGDDSMSTLEFKALVKLIIDLLKNHSTADAIAFLEDLIK